MSINYKKCIVLDLDNTLWGGVIGEDGPNGIKLSLTEPGSYFISFQQVLLNISERGVILAINSKNNPADALNVIRNNQNMILKEHHFAGMRINWQDKASNLIELAKEINIGLDSIVFIDDDPLQREMVRQALPEVEVPDLPTDPKEYAKFILSLPYFPREATTNEDKMRTNMYVTERLRIEKEKQFTNKEDFFRSLGLEFHVRIDDTNNLARLSQLTEKTNQFNIFKNFISEQEMLSLANNPEYILIYGSVVDRFGDYGITNMATIHCLPRKWEIENFIMSCRMIGRGIEESFLSFINQHAENKGVDTVSIRFKETEKNLPAKEFILKHFTDFNLKKETLKSPEWITIKHENI